MKTKRFSDKMEKMLNEQMTREAHQSQVYLAYASLPVIGPQRNSHGET